MSFCKHSVIEYFGLWCLNIYGFCGKLWFVLVDIGVLKLKLSYSTHVWKRNEDYQFFEKIHQWLSQVALMVSGLYVKFC